MLTYRITMQLKGLRGKMKDSIDIMSKMCLHKLQKRDGRQIIKLELKLRQTNLMNS